MDKINEKNQKKKNQKFQKEKHKKKSELYMEEIESLTTRIKNDLPPTGKYSINLKSKSQSENEKLENWELPKENFKDLPLSNKIIKGLNESKYYKMTPIQRSTLPHSLGGRDILGASKTGSGKTLCFLIPILDNLYREGDIKEEGLLSLIILPTRELAIQIFDVINKIGKYFNFSVGLVIGGNNLEKEQKSVNQINILIGTPGRLLQHMSETPFFNADNLKILVIDEADRILDEGFENDINEILTYLPKNRQTLLFSATLTRNLKRLVKINMRSPEYINLSNTDNIITNDIIGNNIDNEKNELSILKNTQNTNLKIPNNINNLLIPKNLNQFYTIVEPEDRINILYSFLKTHKNSKCLIFLSSRKQVRFFTEIFKHLKLGITFLDIHGKQNQNKRSSTYFTFIQKRKSVVLFATDIASRGVDFPAIEWVIQLDPPEDISQYIHRIGRTARYKSEGNSILFVSKKEEEFINELHNKKIDIKKMKIQQGKISNMEIVIRGILTEHSELVQAAQKAISSYLKSVNLFRNKKVFDISTIDLNKLALSYGLVSSPKIVVKKKNDNEDFDNNRKKSKLQKLKEKIKMKKEMKKKDNENKNENKSESENENKNDNKSESDEKEIEGNEDEENEDDDDFLIEKKSNVKLLNKKKKREENEEIKEINDEKSIDDNDNFYNKVKRRLEQNKEADNIKEKVRIINKHKEDKIRAKEKDYEKHGIEIGNENEEYNKNEYNKEEEEEEENIEMSDNENEINTSSKKKQKEAINKKVKINVEHSSIKEKEKAALELLKMKNKLFGQ